MVLSQHLDPARLRAGLKKCVLSACAFDEQGLSRGTVEGILDGSLRADGLLAAQLHGSLARSVEAGTGDAGTFTAWCEGGCAACASSAVIGDREVEELAEALLSWHEGQSASTWIDNRWQARRKLDDEIVWASGVRQWLEATRGTIPEAETRSAVDSCAELLAGRPARRYLLTGYELPADEELREVIPLLDGWQGGALPRSVLQRLYPYPAAWEQATYRGFDPHEARIVWWAWRVDDGVPPVFPELWDYVVEGGRRLSKPSVAEQLITMMHAVVHPGRIVPTARFVAYEGHGIAPLDGRLHRSLTPWGHPVDDINPLTADGRSYMDFWNESDADPFCFEEALVSYVPQPAPYARALRGLGTRLAGLDVGGVAATRAGRASSHLARDIDQAIRNPEATALDYAIALELLLHDGSSRNEITRTLTQGAAHIAGIDDDDRAAIAAVIGNIYNAGALYRHGGEPALHSEGNRLYMKKKLIVDLEVARTMVRRVAGAVLQLLGEGELEPARLAAQASIDRRVSTSLEAAVHRLHGTLGLTLAELNATFERSEALDDWVTLPLVDDDAEGGSRVQALPEPQG